MKCPKCGASVTRVIETHQENELIWRYRVCKVRQYPRTLSGPCGSSKDWSVTPVVLEGYESKFVNTSSSPVGLALMLLLNMTTGTRTVSPAEPQPKQPNLRKLCRTLPNDHHQHRGRLFPRHPRASVDQYGVQRTDDGNTVFNYRDSSGDVIAQKVRNADKSMIRWHGKPKDVAGFVHTCITTETKLSRFAKVNTMYNLFSRYKWQSCWHCPQERNQPPTLSRNTLTSSASSRSLCRH